MNRSALKKKYEVIEGKLICKVKDKNEEQRNIRNIRRNYNGMKRLETKDVLRYYITFVTSKGIKSFTVNYGVYKRLKVGQEGSIRMQGKRFVSFEQKHFGI